MKIKNVTIEQLQNCINQLNEEYGYKIEFNRYPEIKGNFLHFTIQSEKSGIKGARYSHSGRKLKSASWHSHGYLFDIILENHPNAEILTGMRHPKTNRPLTIYKDFDGTVINNWIDRNIGSIMFPVQFSSTSIL